MSTVTNPINVSELSADQIKELESQLRLRRTSAKKAEKYAAFEPTYTDYRNSVIAAKRANDLKKSLLSDLKKLGFGKKAAPSKTGKKK